MPTALETPEHQETLVVDGVDIGQLSDDELYQRLKDYGISIGPVVGTTRCVYERKLYRLLKGQRDNNQDINFNATKYSGGDGNSSPVIKQRRHSSDRNGKILDSKLVSSASKGKSNTVYATCFEIFMLVFLVIVGYVFFQEIQTYSAAEKEYIESDAQNFDHQG